MAGQQISDVVAGSGAFGGIAGAKSDNITGKIGTNGDRLASKQLDQVGPGLAKLAQERFDPTACRLGFVGIVGSKLTKQLAETIPLTLAKPPNDGAMPRHGVTPSQPRDRKGLTPVRDGTGDAAAPCTSCSNRIDTLTRSPLTLSSDDWRRR